MADTPTPKATKPATTRKSTATPSKAAKATSNSTAPKPGTSTAKFAKAIEEAKAGAQAFGKEARESAGAYRDKLTDASTDWVGEAKAMGDTAKVRATEMAKDGKAKASDAISSLGKIVSDNAASIDEKLGSKYGDYARTAARTMQETAAKIDAKDVNELGDDAREFVKKSPGMAIGIAAAVGFMVSRMFRKGSD